MKIPLLLANFPLLAYSVSQSHLSLTKHIDPSHLIFASLASLLKQWDNTLYPNGHALVPGTIPPGTLLYHARKDPNPPPRTEWLAFDAEYSYEVMATWGGESFLSTYTATRPLRVIYLDGASSVLHDTGPLDSQSVLVWGNVSLEQQQFAWQELERAAALCALGQEDGFEGVVRMNAGFELLWCDFDVGLRLVDHINITDPYGHLNGSEQYVPPVYLQESPFPDYDPCEIAPDLCKGPQPITGPFASRGGWERRRAATWHYHSPGETRVKLDLSGFVTFYDPMVTSLAALRAEQGVETRRERQRLLGISSKDAAYVVGRLKEVLARKRADNWKDPREDGYDWGTVIASVVQRYEDRIAELRWVLRNNSLENAVEVASKARSVVYPMIMPYVDMHAYSETSLQWSESAELRCRTTFAVPGSDLASSEVLIQSSIQGVLARICSVLIQIFGESVGLPWSDAMIAKQTIDQWQTAIDELWDWLQWPGWIRCEDVCAWDEICMIPMWPIDNADPEDAIIPRCSKY